MNMERVSVEIEGDYLCSFIYSGVLILVDSDFFLHAYSWEDVVLASLKGVDAFERFSIANYFKNSSSKKIPQKGRGKQYFLDKRELSNCYVCSTEIGVWPSDINIYKNRIYVSSDEGVDIIDFNWSQGRVASFCHAIKIWKESAFSISTNDYFRLAIAAGKSGVLSFVPKNREVSERDISQLLPTTCVDCDWQNEYLIANTVNDGVSVFQFRPIPQQNEFNGSVQEYWKIVNEIKRQPPEICNIDRIGGEKVINSWFAGEKLFYLTDSMGVGFVLRSELEQARSANTNNIRQIDEADSIIASRTASFGTVIELENSLKVLGRESIYSLDDEFTTWRVFPRSRNFANQLHVIKDQQISVLALESPNSEQTREGYGFSVESLGQDIRL